MKRKKSQSLSEAMSFCSPLASLMAAEGTVPIGQFQFDTVMDVENQEKENLFQENIPDKEKIDAGNTDFQPSLGGLIESEEPSPYETVDEKFEEVQIDAIQHFTDIPDYNTAVDSKHPFLVHTPSEYHCIDGWGLVEAAKVAGKSSITCNVEYLENHSEEELAIRKTAGRVKPKAGIASYGETVRNTKWVERKLLASNKDLKVFYHGGARKGQAFTNNTEDNLRKVLSDRLGRSVTTVNQFLNHGTCLNDETLNFLASQNTPKEFFEKAQTAKRTQINALKSRRASDEEIVTQISQKMVDWYGEYSTTGKITPVWNESEMDTETDSGRRSISTGSSKNYPVAKSEVTQVSDTDDVIDGDIEPFEETMETEVNEESVLDPWQGNTVDDQDDSDSLEKVKGDVEELANRLITAVALDDPDLFGKRIREEVLNLSRLSVRAAFFREEAQE